MSSSQTNDWASDPEGVVAPRLATSPREARSTIAAAIAPVTCAPQ